MKITLNNRPEEFDAVSLTIAELLKIRNYTFRMLVIRVNGQLISKDQYEIQKVIDGDEVMVLHLISGG